MVDSLSPCRTNSTSLYLSLSSFVPLLRRLTREWQHDGLEKQMITLRKSYQAPIQSLRGIASVTAGGKGPAAVVHKSPHLFRGIEWPKLKIYKIQHVRPCRYLLYYIHARSRPRRSSLVGSKVWRAENRRVEHQQAQDETIDHWQWNDRYR